jgi:hypothetical protein
MLEEELVDEVVGGEDAGRGRGELFAGGHGGLLLET